MKKASEIRTFVVAGHGGSGKTSLCDLMLFKAGAVDRCGSVDQKTSVSDYNVDEQEKQSSLYSTVMNCEWQNNHLFFVDTPGYGEFVGEPLAAMQAGDSALLVVDAIDGPQMGTIRGWKFSRNLGLPRFVLINRLDRERADFSRVLNQLHEAYGKTVCIPITLPIGVEGGFSKVINVLTATDIPTEVASEVAKYREMLMDTIAESDEKLMERYLEGETLTDEEISKGLKNAIMAGSLVPVFAGSVAKDIGITELMNNIVSLFPNPLDKGSITLADGEKEPVSETGPGQALIFKSVIDPFIGHLIFFKIVSGSFKSDSEVFNISGDSKERFGQMMIMNGKEQKTVTELGPGCIGAIAKLKTAHIGNTFGTTHTVKALPPIIFPNPVMSYSVAAVKSGEEDKIATGLHKIAESDPTVHLKRQDETHELLLSGMGDQHLAHVIKKLKETYKVDVHLDTPKIPYRESITANGEGHYKHKKQTGGAGQFAEVYIRISPNEPGHEFVNDVVGGNIPKNFIPAVEKGVHDAMIKGPLVGCVVERIKVSVYDGKYHPVDSNEMAFKIAGRMAFRDAMSKAHPVLLEPIMKVKVSIPDQYMGDITGDLNHKRGRILGMGMQEGMQVVKAEIPQVEMSKYATELRSMTQGRGSFSMEFDRYEQVPPNVANEIISKYQAEKEEEQ